MHEVVVLAKLRARGDAGSGDGSEIKGDEKGSESEGTARFTKLELLFLSEWRLPFLTMGTMEGDASGTRICNEWFAL